MGSIQANNRQGQVLPNSQHAADAVEKRQTRGLSWSRLGVAGLLAGAATLQGLPGGVAGGGLVPRTGSALQNNWEAAGLSGPGRRLAADAPSPQPGPSDWPALRARDTDMTPAQLNTFETHWDPQIDPDLYRFADSIQDVSWQPTDLPLFGASNSALTGGLRAAQQVVSFGSSDGGVGAAAAVFASTQPQTLARLLESDPNTGLVEITLYFKTHALPGGFESVRLPMNATLPVNTTSHRIVGANQPNASSWFAYAAKAFAMLTEAPGPQVVNNFRTALQALLGREVQEVDLTRLADICASGPFDSALSTLPSMGFDVQMQRLATTGFGGLRFRDGFQLQDMEGYNPETGWVEFSDGHLEPALGGRAIRVKSASGHADTVDAIIMGSHPYACLTVLRGEAKETLPPLSALSLYNAQGFNYEPAAAAASNSSHVRDNAALPTVPAAFTLPIGWVKRLAQTLYVA